MTDKFEVHISPLDHYARYRHQKHTLVVIQFDIVQDGIQFDNGFNGRYECCDIILKEIVETADDFLAGKFRKNECLSFEIPYVVGGYIRYGYYFDIHVGKEPEENYWVFNVTPNFHAEKREIKYSCILSREQVAALRQSVAEQIKEFDWQNCGKTEFFMFAVPDKSYEWCYSAKKMEEELNVLFAGDRLETIYVSGMNYADPLRVKENFVNYYVGPRVYLEFHNRHADILAHAGGLFELRWYDAKEVSKTHFYDLLDNENTDEVLCDTSYPFQLNYAGETVKHIAVKPTNCWPWRAKGFDESKVSDPVEVPDMIKISLGNGTLLTIAGWDDDFMIQMEEAN